ncbi:hypothetical protein DIPPA_25260 [Diplonema papillatum]|nr:hypothetical protein DIPPA_25260 [Diplonema papillatum]
MDEARAAVEELEKAVDGVFGAERDKILKQKADYAVSLIPDAADATAVKRAEALSLRGRALCAMTGSYAKPAEGAAYLSKAVKMNPKCAESWNALGHSQWSDGKLREALTSYNAALESDATNAKALRNSALIMRSLGGPANMQQAAERAKKALSLNLDDSTSWYTHGMLQLTRYFKVTFDQSDLRSALKAFDIADKKGSGHPDIHMNRGQCQRYMILWKEALASFTAALELDAVFEEAAQARDSLQLFFQVLQKKYEGWCGYNDKALSKHVASLPAEPRRPMSCSIIPTTELTQSEGYVSGDKCVVLCVLELIDDSSLPVYYLACDANRNRVLLAVYGIDMKALPSGCELIYRNPAYYTREVPGEKPWSCLVLIVDRASVITVNGRKIDRGCWSSMELNVKRKSTS